VQLVAGTATLMGLLACVAALLRAQRTSTERSLWQRLSLAAGVVCADVLVWQLLQHLGLVGVWSAVVVVVPWMVVFLALYGALVRWNRYPTALADPHDTLNGLSSVLVATALADTVLRAMWAPATTATWWELPIRVLPLAVLTVCLGTATSLPALAGLGRDRRYWLLTTALVGLLVAAGGWLSQLGEPGAAVPVWTVLCAAGSAALLVVAALDREQASDPRPTAASASTQGAFGVLVTALATVMLVYLSAGTAVAAVMAVAGGVGSGLRLRNNVSDLAHLAQVKRQALTDDLTGLANRRALLGRLSVQLSAGQHLVLALLDLDRFKEVNDGLGHQAGDELIIAVAERLRAHLPTGHLLARLGGDEFAVVMTRPVSAGAAADTTSSSTDSTIMSAGALGEAITQAMVAPFAIGVATVHVASSVGVVTTAVEALSHRGDSGADTSEAEHSDAGGLDEVAVGAAVLAGNSDQQATELLRRADAAMYQAKRTRSKVAVYDRLTHLESAGELMLIEQLRSALVTGQLRLHHQPQVCATTGRVCGVEALVRWQHPTRGLLMPSAFLASAETHGLMGPLSDAVMALAVAQLAAFRSAGTDLRMSVNLSASNLLDTSLPARVADLLHTSGVPSAALVLEVTESVLISDPERSLAVLRDLADLGVGLSIDDYGTGYSSLAYLQRLPVHELKLDRSLTCGLLDNSKARAVVASAVELAHALGLRVIAEGVEDPATRDELIALRCDELQGYLYSAPLSAHDLQQWMDAWPSAAGLGLPRSTI